MFFGESTDFQIKGAYGDFESPGSGFNWSIPSSESLLPDVNTSELFRTPSFATDGLSLIDDRSNTSFWNFDQSKITSGLSDVLGSVIQAGGKLALQASADSINKGANQQGQLGAFLKNFQSTKTGAQINAGAMATRVQNFFGNPMVWLAAIAGIGLIVFMKLRA